MKWNALLENRICGARPAKWPVGRLFLLAAGLAVLSLFLLNCSKKGPAEKVGEKIDDGVESLKDKAEGVLDPKGPLEKAGKKIDGMIDTVKNAVKPE